MSFTSRIHKMFHKESKHSKLNSSRPSSIANVFMQYIVWTLNGSVVIKNPYISRKVQNAKQRLKVVKIKKSIWVRTLLTGWSHRPLLAPPVNIFSCNRVKNDGLVSISQHYLQQFHS
jgi:hypothetical protein